MILLLSIIQYLSYNIDIIQYCLSLSDLLHYSLLHYFNCLDALSPCPEQTCYPFPEMYFSYHIALDHFSLSNSLFETSSKLQVAYFIHVKFNGMFIMYIVGITTGIFC